MTESRCANNLDVVEDALGESMARRLAAVIFHACWITGSVFTDRCRVVELSDLQRPYDLVRVEEDA